jgi:uncharacterized membrane protein
MNHSEKEKWSITELFSDLTRNLTSLVRQEILLAKTEMKSKISQVGASGAYIGAGGALLYAGFLVLLGAAVFGLSTIMPIWLSALLVGLIVAFIGTGLLLKGRNDLKAHNLKPEKTIRSVRQDIDFTKEQFRRAS